VNYRHKVGVYKLRLDSFGKNMLVIPPTAHVYEFGELQTGPVGDVSLTVRCSWLAARRFPGKLIPLSR
jgi:hypothetical protein